MQLLLGVRICCNNVIKKSQSTVVCTLFSFPVSYGGSHFLSKSLQFQARAFSCFSQSSLLKKNEFRPYNCSWTTASVRKTRNISSGYKMPHAGNDTNVFRLDDYDCIGFDLDNTLCEYNITPAVEMEYNVLASYLVKTKGYDPNYLLQPLEKDAIEFMQKGLLVDFANGNLLKVGENGVIFKASHGTRFMTDKQIEDVYGKNRRWEVTDEFCKNMLVAWNGPLSERMRALLDYFDMPASLAFARIVDSLDFKLGRPADVYNVWPDVLAGLHNIYKREHFLTGEGGYFQEIKSNPQRFIKQCSPDILDWLKRIKQSKITFLITGSNCDFASLTAENSLGENWKSLFDIVICYARKPGFFSGCRPFIDLNGFQETNPLNGSDLELGKIYSQGNWQELYQLFGRKLNKKEPRCLYFGDNLIQDIYTPSEYTKCDTVAVVEELSVEMIEKPFENVSLHPSEAVLASEPWGSYFFDSKNNTYTLWGGIINNYSRVCIPTLSVFAQYPINHKFVSFDHGSKDGGYFPESPIFSKVQKKIKMQ